MPTEVLHVDAQWPDPGAIQRAAGVLRAGGLVAFPTETVYGLGASALAAEAVAKIFAAKGRPPSNPLIVHIASVQAAAELVRAWPKSARVLTEKFWPGPLTLVLPKASAVPDIVTGGGQTVALRVPSHPVALALLETCALPLAAPSANRSTALSPTRGDHVLRGLADTIDLLLDAGATPGGLESTVLDLTSPTPRLLRPGLAAVADIEALIGPVARPNFLAPVDGEPLPGPGMLPRHYAPRTKLEIAHATGWARVKELCEQGLRVGWITFGLEACPSISGVLAREMPKDPVLYAAQLYAMLHDLDEANLDRIVVATPPPTEAWLAIRDRLKRASAEE